MQSNTIRSIEFGNREIMELTIKFGQSNKIERSIT